MAEHIIRPRMIPHPGSMALLHDNNQDRSLSGSVALHYSLTAFGSTPVCAARSPFRPEDIDLNSTCCCCGLVRARSRHPRNVERLWLERIEGPNSQKYYIETTAETYSANTVKWKQSWWWKQCDRGRDNLAAGAFRTAGKDWRSGECG